MGIRKLRIGCLTRMWEQDVDFLCHYRWRKKDGWISIDKVHGHWASRGWTARGSQQPFAYTREPSLIPQSLHESPGQNLSDTHDQHMLTSLSLKHRIGFGWSLVMDRVHQLHLHRRVTTRQNVILYPGTAPMEPWYKPARIPLIPISVVIAFMNTALSHSL